MSTYQLLLFAHILFVVTWLGGTVCLQVLGLRAARASQARVAEFMADAEWLGHRLLAPASLLVVAFGGLLAHHLGYALTDLWILIALVAFTFSFVVGAMYLDPESSRLANLIADRGAEHPHVRARIRRLMFLSRIELLLLLAVILDMVVKPTT